MILGPSDQNELHFTSSLSKIWDLGERIFCGTIPLSFFCIFFISFFLFLTSWHFICKFFDNFYVLPFAYLFRSHVRENECIIFCLSSPCFSIATSSNALVKDSFKWVFKNGSVASSGHSWGTHTLFGHKQSFWDLNSGFWFKLFVSFIISGFLLVSCFVSSDFKSSRDPS